MRVAMMLYAGFQLLEVSGPMDVFEAANRLCGAPFYEQHVVGLSPGPVASSNGIEVGTTESLRDARTPFDIVLVPGSPAIRPEHDHPELVAWLRQTGRSAGKLASVSNGTFLVARAGLADHRWVTTQGRDAQHLANQYPLVHVTTDLNCLKDGNLYSSDGVTAGIHLALALVEEDLGESMVERIADVLLR